MNETKKYPLWTYDFTVITIGSVISMVGGTMSGFAISLLVLDYTGSTFLYTLFIVCFQLPQLICPLLAGPYLDRMSRKKVIYTLDFTSAALYLVLYVFLKNGMFNYFGLLLFCVIFGIIESIYAVAYESFYPNLITEGNYRKAYSVSSMLWPLAAMTTPIAAMVYDKIGTVAPLFAVNAICFFIAACFERTIRHQETHMEKAAAADGLSPLARFRRDFNEGIDYIRSEKGLLIITLYFAGSNLVYGADNLQLPFFKNNPELFAAWPIAVVTLYTLVTNCGVVGRFAGGFVQYLIRFKKEKKFAIAIFVYTTLCIIDATLLFMPVPLMAIACFITGILGVTSYTIRSAATQMYVPDTKRARFNGTFMMLNSLGGIVGNLVCGALGDFLPERAVIMGANLFGLVLVYLFMYRGREHVKRIYNQDV